MTSPDRHTVDGDNQLSFCTTDNEVDISPEIRLAATHFEAFTRRLLDKERAGQIRKILRDLEVKSKEPDFTAE